MSHRQIGIKVNAFVDEGVAPLVAALSSFSELETLESCQRDGDGPWVCFRFGENGWEGLVAFVFVFLAPSLEEAVGDDAEISVRPAFGGAIADLSVKPDQCDQVARVIVQIAASYKRPRP